MTEYVETAWVGVTAVYLPKSMPRDLALTWEFIGPAAEIPTTVTDPEFSNTTNLTPSEPVFQWTNELAENPIPEVSPTMVEPILHTIPLWSLVPFGGALIFAGAAVRRRRRLFSLAMARVMLVLAIVLGPFGKPGGGTAVDRICNAGDR